MSRRRSPRPAATAFRAALGRAAPQTPLAAVQAAWVEVVGGPLAAVAEPVAEKEGTVTVACVDAVWVQELDMMQTQLLDRLEAALGDTAPTALRFRLRKDPARRP